MWDNVIPIPCNIAAINTFHSCNRLNAERHISDRKGGCLVLLSPRNALTERELTLRLSIHRTITRLIQCKNYAALPESMKLELSTLLRDVLSNSNDDKI
jgi:hypothetical protein